MDVAVIEPSSVSARRWWGARRLRYNVALIAAGFAAFLCLAGVMEWISKTMVVPEGKFLQLELNVVLMGGCYLIVMGVANVCYFLGPIVEYFAQPQDVMRYRRTAFRLGLIFSVILPFLAPLLLLLRAVVAPESLIDDNMP